MTAVASSRWAGAITREVENQYQLGMRALSAHVTDLRQAIKVLWRSGAHCAPVSRIWYPPPRAAVGVATDPRVSDSPRRVG